MHPRTERMSIEPQRDDDEKSNVNDELGKMKLFDEYL